MTFEAEIRSAKEWNAPARPPLWPHQWVKCRFDTISAHRLIYKTKLNKELCWKYEKQYFSCFLCLILGFNLGDLLVTVSIISSDLRCASHARVAPAENPNEFHKTKHQQRRSQRQKTRRRRKKNERKMIFVNWIHDLIPTVAMRRCPNVNIGWSTVDYRSLIIHTVNYRLINWWRLNICQHRVDGLCVQAHHRQTDYQCNSLNPYCINLIIVWNFPRPSSPCFVLVGL